MRRFPAGAVRAASVAVVTFVAFACVRPRTAAVDPAMTPPAPVAATPEATPAALPTPSTPAPATPAPAPASDEAFERTVRPILFRTCTPCHVPGGIMYGRMPFDRAETIRDHRAGVLRRLKGDDRTAVEGWLGPGS